MSTVLRAVKIRLYPDTKQEQIMRQTAGSARFVWNRLLDERIKVYEKYKDDKESRKNYKYLTTKQLKQEFEWLKNCDSLGLNQEIQKLNQAFQNFYNGLSGKYKQRYGFPKFKKKKNYSKYKSQAVNKEAILIDFENRKIKLPKLKWVDFRDNLDCIDESINGKIKNVTITITPTNKFIASVCYETEIDVPEKSDSTKAKCIGLDMKAGDLYVDSNGSLAGYPIQRIKQLEDKARREQQRLSSKVKFSKNWNKQRVRLARRHEQIANLRESVLQKLSTDLVREYDMIAIEDLSINGLMKGKYAKSMTRISYSMFVRMLEYKADWYGKRIVKVAKNFPSTQLCSVCGYRNRQIAGIENLGIKKWTCPECGTRHDRDINAAINILHEGVNIWVGQSMSDTGQQDACSASA